MGVVAGDAVLDVVVADVVVSIDKNFKVVLVLVGILDGSEGRLKTRANFS